MSNRSADPNEALGRLAKKMGAHRAVIATHDGLLIAGAGGDADALEELAAYAPSGLPAKIQRPAGLSSKRIELCGERFYLAVLK
jgi:hypothetical protein